MFSRAFTLACLVSSAPVANAQTELCVLIKTTNGTDWTITAELLNPASTVLAVISDLGFAMNGSGFANFRYNLAFESDFFGAPIVNVSPDQIDFLGGNNIPPLNNDGGPDSSNPLHIASFTATDVDSFAFVGEVNGAYVGVPFPVILTYQGANYSDTPYSIKIVPAPASAAAFVGVAGLALMRRR